MAKSWAFSSAEIGFKPNLDPRDMQEITKKGEYISLKQAAAISGYSADYVGQLIRSGKLPGKQVYSNVAWMTTEEDLRAYLDGNKKASGAKTARIKEGTSSLERLALMHNVATWIVIALFGLFLVFLGYVLAVSTDQRISQKNLEKLEEQKNI